MMGPGGQIWQTGKPNTKVSYGFLAEEWGGEQLGFVPGVLTRE